MAGIVEGAALVELADSGAVHGVFTDLAQATGAHGVEFAPNAVEGVSHIAENLVDTAQGLVLPVATVLLMYAGLKKMFEGVTGTQRRRG